MAYEFTVDSYRTFSDDIINANGDQAIITSKLADMQDAFTNSIGRLTKAEQDTESLKQENERLRQANLDLFLRIGESAKPSTDKQASDEDMSEGVDEYMNKFFDKLEGKK